MKMRRHTVTDIVSAVYCEQKVVHDRHHDKAMTPEGWRKAAQGTFEHKRFKVDGYTRNPVRLLAKLASDKPQYRHRPQADSRCFIASQVYGLDAPETDALRAWRDRALMTSAAGRALVTLYYRLSPIAVRLLRRSDHATRLMRLCLDAFVRRVGGMP